MKEELANSRWTWKIILGQQDLPANKLIHPESVYEISQDIIQQPTRMTNRKSKVFFHVSIPYIYNLTQITPKGSLVGNYRSTLRLIFRLMMSKKAKNKKK